ncbi:MAG: GNAT family N-acetyltransferase [Chloroflexi bacterium]|nr:GNAT family N-acetyltransferase [Chloroflexota bacterium]
MLRGEKVKLRAVEREDLKTLYQLEQDLDLVLMADGNWQPIPLATMEKGFDKDVENEDRSWFIIEADGKVIGSVGLHHRDRRLHMSAFGIAIYDREYLGKGYGRDAIATLFKWAFDIQNYRRIWLETWSTNERAIRCYQSLGFVEEGRLRQHGYYDGKYFDVVLMGLMRSEWEARRNR